MHSVTPLKRVLLDEGRKQSWLAERVGLDQASLSRIVNGLHADASVQARIAETLGRSVDELFPSHNPVIGGNGRGAQAA